MRATIAEMLGITDAWAVVDQVHGSDVVTADRPGNLGPADAIITRTSGLPLAIGTADCVPVVFVGSEQVGIAHAGWRGVVAGVVDATMASMDAPPDTVVIGPHIGRCCYEVGADVVDQLGGFEGTTSWNTTSVDLAAAIRAQVPASVEVVEIGPCTMCDPSYASFRRDATAERQVAVVWR
ncbi:MAG: polyphenol oxidase family protein [Acidimicrobiia bacterium]|nr:polyphenol oxidase family protein [Acidimicrobiia bacterium]